MGSINLDFLGRDTTRKTSALYSDLYLELSNDYKIRGNFTRSETQVSDIKVSHDIDAIRNSLTGLFSTYPGERLLLPEYGLNIRRFIFAPVSTGSAYAIGELMSEAIERWERRIELLDLSIIPLIDEHRYDISLTFNAPALKSDANFLGSVVEGDGFIRG